MTSDEPAYADCVGSNQLLCKVGHHLGSEHFHTPHHAVVWNLPTGVEPQDGPSHTEILAQPTKPFDAPSGVSNTPIDSANLS